MQDVDLVSALLKRAGITPSDEELAALGEGLATLKERVDRQYAVQAGHHGDTGPILTLLGPASSSEAANR